MNGFRSVRKISKIVFEEGHELHGLEITVRSSPLAEQRAYYDKYPHDEVDSFKRVEYEGRHFLKYVVGWNLQDEDGNPVPVTWEAYSNNIELSWIGPIMAAYTGRAVGAKVETDTEKKSGTGDGTATTRHTEESLPMESLP